MQKDNKLEKYQNKKGKYRYFWVTMRERDEILQMIYDASTNTPNFKSMEINLESMIN
jgi:hypothetical protein